MTDTEHLNKIVATEPPPASAQPSACPHCGAIAHDDAPVTDWSCGSAAIGRSARCYEREIARLIAQLAEAKRGDTELRLSLFNANCARDTTLARVAVLEGALRRIAAYFSTNELWNHGVVGGDDNLTPAVIAKDALTADASPLLEAVREAVDSVFESCKHTDHIAIRRYIDAALTKLRPFAGGRGGPVKISFEHQQPYSPFDDPPEHHNSIAGGGKDAQP